MQVRTLLVLLALAVFLTARPAVGQSAEPVPAAEYQVYTLQHKPAAVAQRVLGEMLAGYGDQVHMVVDAKTGRIMLRGPAEVQQIARQVLAAIDHADPATASETPAVARATSRAAEPTGPAAPPTSPSAVPPRAADAPSTAATSQTVRLSFVKASQLESQLKGILGDRLAAVPTQDLRRTEYSFTDTAGRQARLAIDVPADMVTVSGPPRLTDQLARLVRALDNLPPFSGDAVQVLPLRRANPAQVREAVDAYRGGNGDAPAPNPKASGRTAPAGRRQGGVQLASYFRPSGARPTRLVACLYQLPDDLPAAPPGNQPRGAEPIPAVAADEPDQQQRLREVRNDVDVETLPDLDAIILRGRPHDVEQLRRIIEEIERLSVETQPAIEIVALRNVGCEPLVAMIKQISADLIGGRQGRVSVTSLVKPNAVLLIGWGDAVAAIKELISKLDQPVAPESQVRVVRLRHASAATVATTIQGMFAARAGTAASAAGGLGTQAKITADARTNSLVVQAAPRDMAEIEALIARLDQSRGEAVRQARIFKLNNSLATDLAAVLQSAIAASKTGTAGAAAGQKSAALELLALDGKGQKLLRAGVLDDVQITPDPQINALVVSAPAESIDLLAALIEQLDTPSAVAQIKVFHVTNGDANSLVLTLRMLLPSSGGMPTGTRVAGVDAAPGLLPTRFSVDTRTNSIIAAGSQSELTIIEALLIRLDEDQGQQRRNAVFRLKNAPAADVARSINEFLRSERQVQQAVPAVVSAFQQIESEVVVVPETVSNSLIISATPRFFDDIKDLVEKLDAEPPQVMIQVLIAQVTLSNFDEFGIELGLQDSVLFDRSLLGNLITLTNTTQTSTSSGIVTSTQQNIVAANNDPGYDFNNKPLGNSGSNNALASKGTIGTQGLSSFALNRTNNNLGFGGLVLSASSESVSVLIRALQECRRMEVLSRPQIMTLDNQPAYVQVGKRVPRIVGSTINQFGSQNAIVLENVGLILGVTPRISPDGRIVMEVDAEKSEVGPIDEGIPVSTVNNTVIKSPNIELTTAQTTVSAVDGETIIIGGLITKSKIDIDRRVPLLADIPVLGNLFKYQSHDRQRTEMLIVLTPRIIRKPEDAERVKAAEEARMHWCMGDVNAIHGDFAMLARNRNELVPVVYPDRNPRGALPTAAGNAANPPEGVATPPGQPAPLAPDAVPAGPAEPPLTPPLPIPPPGASGQSTLRVVPSAAPPSDDPPVKAAQYVQPLPPVSAPSGYTPPATPPYTPPPAPQSTPPWPRDYQPPQQDYTPPGIVPR